MRLLDALSSEPDPHTTVSAAAEALDVHVADSLSGLEVAPLREAGRIADIGAGAGFPGLVLAIALPDAHVDLIESASRKTAVIERLAAGAGLGNATAVTARAEEWAANEGRSVYDVVTARALAALPVLVEYAAPLLMDGGHLVAWKGACEPSEELAGRQAAAATGMEATGALPVKPFAESRDRRLYVFKKVSPTPDKFPRRPGMATKRPLG